MADSLLARARPLLGTLVEIRASHSESAALQGALDAAFAAVSRIHHLMSVHEPTSDLARLNAALPGTPVALADDTVQVLDFALALAAASDGLFDPTIGGQLSAQGLLPRPQRTPDPTASWRDLSLQAGAACCQQPLLVDLGGVAKGYAVDVAFALLQAAGCHEILINAGGDMRVQVSTPEPVHIRLADGALLPALSLTEGALATSCFSRSGQSDPAVISHLIRPGHGLLRTAGTSIVVLAPSCMVADALTKPMALAPTLTAPLLKKFAAEAVEIAQNAAGIQVRRWPNRHPGESDVEIA